MDLIGKKFGRLLVIANSHKEHFVVCKCSCGNISEVRATSLTTRKNPTLSCGCLQREVAHKTGAKTIQKNAEKQIAQNMQFNTNFQVIENPHPPKNSTSGVKGVSWNKSRNMWEAYIQVHSKHIHLGRFFDKNDAIKARRLAEEKFFIPLIEAKNQI